jgi:hypothetical protein
MADLTIHETIAALKNVGLRAPMPFHDTLVQEDYRMIATAVNWLEDSEELLRLVRAERNARKKQHKLYIKDKKQLLTSRGEGSLISRKFSDAITASEEAYAALHQWVDEHPEG